MSGAGIIKASTPGQALSIVIALGKYEIGSREARMLLAHAAGIDMTNLADLSVEEFTEDLVQRYLTLVERRARCEPMSHILGYRDFYNARFEVSKSVLDPRPETEVLIRIALETPFKSVLDLGTGSGCILLTLLAECPDARGVGIDISDPALALARRNAAGLAVEDRTRLIRSDWFQNVSGTFDLIVSNPPYIATNEMNALAPELAYEPRAALTDEGDGLGAYRIIAPRAADHLQPGGRILVEIGPTQGRSVADLFAASGFADIALHPDLDGRDRVVSALKAA